MFNPLILNNPISRWLIAISLFILTFVVGKVVYWILSRWVKRLTQKTETKLDDIIIDMLEEPFAFAVVLVGARYSLSWLTLPDSIAAWPDDAFQFLLAITIAWFAVRLYVFKPVPNLPRRRARAMGIGGIEAGERPSALYSLDDF